MERSAGRSTARSLCGKFPFIQPSPDAKPNLNGIESGSPRLVGTTTHGKLFTVGGGDDIIQLLHVWGEHLSCGYIGCKLNQQLT